MKTIHPAECVLKNTQYQMKYFHKSEGTSSAFWEQQTVKLPL